MSGDSYRLNQCQRRARHAPAEDQSAETNRA
jgi:hypothetical protein